jgi:hypothetical protein
MSVWSDGQTAINDLYKHDHNLGNEAYTAFSDYLANGNRTPGLTFLAAMPAVISMAKDPTVKAAYTKDTQALTAYINAHGSILGGVHRLSPPGGTLQGNLVKGAGQVAKDAGNLITNPFGAIFQAHIWVRVAEVALGLILIAVGLARLTDAVPAATKIAAKLA